MSLPLPSSTPPDPPTPEPTSPDSESVKTSPTAFVERLAAKALDPAIGRQASERQEQAHLEIVDALVADLDFDQEASATIKKVFYEDYQGTWKRILAAWDAYTSEVGQQRIVDMEDEQDFFPVDQLHRQWAIYAATLRTGLYQPHSPENFEWFVAALLQSEDPAPAPAKVTQAKPVFQPGADVCLICIPDLLGNPRPQVVRMANPIPPLEGDGLILVRPGALPRRAVVVGPSYLLDQDTPEVRNTILCMDHGRKAWTELIID